jgi:hypothetical protein
VIAYDASGGIVWSSGVVPDGVDPDPSEPDLFRFWDDTFDAADQPAHFFWEVARNDAATLLPPTKTLCMAEDGYYHSVKHEYLPFNPAGVVRITARVLIRPMPFELMDLLGIDPAIQAEMPTHVLAGSEVEWTPATQNPLSHCVERPSTPVNVCD